MVMFSLTMSRAALVLVVAQYGRDAKVGLLNEGLFNAIIIYIIVTWLVGPLLADAFSKQASKETGR